MFFRCLQAFVDKSPISGDGWVAPCGANFWFLQTPFR